MVVIRQWAAIVVGGCAVVDYSYAVVGIQVGVVGGRSQLLAREAAAMMVAKNTEAVGLRVMNGVHDAKVMPLETPVKPNGKALS